MKGGRFILLVLALALPVLIFLFLKFFGKNEFDVPPLYTDGAPFRDGCGRVFTGPYAIPEEVLSQFGWSEKDSLSLFYVGELHEGKQWDRLRTHPATARLRMFGISVDSILNQSEAMKYSKLSPDSVQLIQRCFFFLTEPYDLVLVDNERRIRGNYQLNNREEIDRLILETKIILKKY
ncbi:MAG: hypothetical protein KF687_14065 [Cyclobacteriaceae bacterium]|nr:hypothetical protein [Cyclobacteriaceae bacterium]